MFENERLAVELLLPVLTNKACHGWDSNTQPSSCEVNALTDCATIAAKLCCITPVTTCIKFDAIAANFGPTL